MNSDILRISHIVFLPLFREEKSSQGKRLWYTFVSKHYELTACLIFSVFKHYLEMTVYTNISCFIKEVSENVILLLILIVININNNE